MTIDDFVTCMATRDFPRNGYQKQQQNQEDGASCLINTYLIDISKPFSNVIKSFLPCDIIY